MGSLCSTSVESGNGREAKKVSTEDSDEERSGSSSKDNGTKKKKEEGGETKTLKSAQNDSNSQETTAKLLSEPNTFDEKESVPEVIPEPREVIDKLLSSGYNEKLHIEVENIRWSSSYEKDLQCDQKFHVLSKKKKKGEEITTSKKKKSFSKYVYMCACMQKKKKKKTNKIMLRWKGQEPALIKFIDKEWPYFGRHNKGERDTVCFDALKKSYVCKEKLGSGNFGVVKLAVRIKDDRKFAAKFINKKRLELEDLKGLMMEISVMKYLSSPEHPNVARLFEVFDSPFQMTQGFSEKTAANLFAQLMSALSYMHDKGIIHRDLKPENLMFETKDLNAQLKLVDFGLAMRLKPVVTDSGDATSQQTTWKKIQEFAGTPEFMAPEIYRDEFYDSSVDMWSAGCILY
ncbi:Calcium/calmodulin-dependent protein kinase type II alpha chain, partial [Reticulomyxa filosa]